MKGKNTQEKSKSSLNDGVNKIQTPIEKITEKETKKISFDMNVKKIDINGNNIKNTNQEKAENLKGIHLSQEEKESFIGILGYLNYNLNHERDYKIISVDKFYGKINE